ncbi:unnamed protein product [Brassica napus]|uniref:(rape) hypothetical protein n=1 Tax=Brassica napus TaxID=3708 RepID=A0A816L300_BRANA|nr:unnamed protein product [Brassica napus]
MDDGFALRDETIRLLAARVKELEQDKIQRENWSFQFGEYETCEASGGKGRDAESEEEADKDGKNSESDASLQLYTLLFLLRQHLKMLRVRKRLRKRLMRSLAMRMK